MTKATRVCRRCKQVLSPLAFDMAPAGKRYGYCQACRVDVGSDVRFECPDLDPSFGHWLAGFVDGEGCFRILPTQHGGFVCRFMINLRDDDLPILEEIVRLTGLGEIEHRENRTRWNPQAQWVVRNRRDCAPLVALFDRYPLRAKKRHDFAVWREAVQDWVSREGRGRQFDWTHMRELRTALHDGRQYSAVP